MVMSLAGGALTLVMMIERAAAHDSQGAIEVPYGVAIAIAGASRASRTDS